MPPTHTNAEEANYTWATENTDWKDGKNGEEGEILEK
jgi:hypothetical protein